MTAAQWAQIGYELLGGIIGLGVFAAGYEILIRIERRKAK